jgi:hypothetical protein
MSEETIPQLRERIDELTKQNKALAQQVPELQKENRVLKARDIFGQKGFAPEGGELFAAAHPEGEITDELVSSFVERYKFGKAGSPSEGGTVVPQDEGSDAPEASADTEGLDALARGGSRAGDGGSGGSQSEPMTRAEWQALYKRDPAAAKAANRQGRVQISKDNVYVASGSVLGNPYAPSQE